MYISAFGYIPVYREQNCMRQTNELPLPLIRVFGRRTEREETISFFKSSEAEIISKWVSKNFMYQPG
jgi:hypothetical protein